MATNLTAGAVNVIVSDRDLEKARDLAEQLGPKAVAMTIDAALKKADIVILSILFDVMKKFVVEHRADLAGKIVVDPSNPIAPEGQGFKKIIPPDQSAGKIIADLLPDGAELVKAFGTLSARSLEAEANRKPEPAVLFYATDFPEAGKAVAKLISASGFAPVSIGGIDQAVRIEAFGEEAVLSVTSVDEAHDPPPSHGDRLHDSPLGADLSGVVVRALAERMNSAE